MQSSRIPPLLDRVLRVPQPDSLVLLTSVLGATTNWLLLRYLYACLASDPSPPRSRRSLGDPKSAGADRPPLKVVLVSWLRDYEFWKAEAKRSMGVDLGRLTAQGRFAFIDAMTAFSYSSRTVATPTGSSYKGGSSRSLSSPALDHLEQTVLHAAGIDISPSDGSSQSNSTILILDAPDFVVAVSDPRAGGQMDLQLLQTIHRLRRHPAIRATIVAAQADAPLLVPPSHGNPSHANLAGHDASPLEVAHTAFIGRLAHQASIRVSLRMLDTGAAGDVSGVGRVTYGQPFMADAADREEEDLPPSEASEWLYFVAVDGSAKVWERGSGTTVG